MAANRIKHGYFGNNNNNDDDKMSSEKRICALEQELLHKNLEIEALQEAIKRLPEYAKIEGDICIKPKERKMSQAVLIQSYKPLTVTDRRRQIEDYCRDLASLGLLNHRQK